MGLPLLILQLAVATPPGPSADAPAARPDIELRVRVQAKSLAIASEGASELSVRADPSAGQAVEVRGKLPPGARTARNLDLRLDAQATIADPRNLESTKTGESRP